MLRAATVIKLQQQEHRRSNAGRGDGDRLKTPQAERFTSSQADPGAGVQIIRTALGFRQFSLRGLEGARGEWSPVTTAWNIKRIFALVPA